VDCGPDAGSLHWSIAAWGHTTTGYLVFVNGVQFADVAQSPWVVGGLDCGTTFTLGVEAHDGSGNHSRLYTSNYSTPACAPPGNTALPVITDTTSSGTFLQGDSLSTTNGTWSGAPTSFTRQWQDCDNVGGNCTNISGATSTTYVLTSTDVGHTIRARITATNSAGSTGASSAQSIAVTNTGAPLVYADGTSLASYSPVVAHGQCGNAPYSLPSINNRARGSLFFTTIGGLTAYQMLDQQTATGTTLTSPPYNAGSDGSVADLEACNINGSLSRLDSTPAGFDEYIGFMVYVPSDPTVPNDVGETMVAEYHQTPNGNPALAFMLHNDNLKAVECTGDTTIDYGRTCTVNQNNTPLYAIPPGHLTAGAWNEVAFHVHWSGGTDGAEEFYYKTRGDPSWTASSTLSGKPTLSTIGTSPVTTQPSYTDSTAMNYGDLFTTQDFSTYVTRVTLASNLSTVESTLDAGGGSSGGVPVNTAAPTITGTPAVENTLTAQTGTWTNTPTSYKYQWVNCYHSSCTNITGATGATYVPTTHGQGGDTVKVQVTGHNATGDGTPVTSAATGTINGGSKGTCTGTCSAATGGNGGNPGWVRIGQSFADTNATSCASAVAQGDGSLCDGASGHATPKTETPGAGTCSAPCGNFEYYVPTNLKTTSADPAVPLVLGGDEGGFSGSTTETDWAPAAVANRFIAVDLTNSYNVTEQTGTYPHELTFPPAQLTCGSAGNSACYYKPYLDGVISYMEAHFHIDPNMIYYSGGSKGGTFAEELVCDPQTNQEFAGVQAGSAHMQVHGTSNNTNPFCPTMASGSSSQYHQTQIQWYWGDNDTAGPGGAPNWNTGALNVNWQQSELQGEADFGNAMGCNATQNQNATVGTAGSVTVTERTWGDCDYASRTSLLEYAGSACHAQGCSPTPATAQGGVDVATEAWHFWTTGSP
jgi:poly(3-hydroxybutyrate) depolymerase